MMYDQRMKTRCTYHGLRLAKFLILFTITTGLAHSAYSDSALNAQATSILQKRCFDCHGPDTQHNGLRLDSLDRVLKGGESGRPALQANSSSTSLLIEKITASDSNIRMPFGRAPLSRAEIDVLTRWIDSGANWFVKSDPSQHWSFIAPTRVSPPALNDTFTVHNPIDNFILTRALNEHLAPSETASRYTLLRRTSLELIGLPPTLEEIEAFIADTDAGAYDRLLDRLFASPHYGERQALRWLDIARYADTNGYEKDRHRSIWPYRDWVINAYNANMPFDQFVREQLAGDLLPNATESQRIATGFHRNTMLNEEGGIDAAEDRFKRTVDRTNTTSTAFLGLTMGCAQCHSHKSDPISRTEYYEFFAFFNDTEEAIMPLKDPDITRAANRATRIGSGLQNWMTWLGTRDANSMAAFDAWLKKNSEEGYLWMTPTPINMRSEKGATLLMQPDTSILATGDIPNDDTYTINLKLSGQKLTGLRLEVFPDASLPGNGPGRGTILSEGGFLLTELEAALVQGEVVTHILICDASQSHSSKDKTANKALDGKADTGWSIDGQTGKENRAVFSFIDAIPSTPGDILRVTLHHDYIHQHTIGRFRLSITSDDSPKASSLPGAIEDTIGGGERQIAETDRDALKSFYFTNVAPELKKWQTKRAKFLGESPKQKTTLVLTQRTPPRETRVHNRGEFNSPRRKVSADTPKILPEIATDASTDRLALANWITGPENPLTARVVMNRLWQQVFGKGIVLTTDDFGLEGSPPTHPQLLDWLALEFIESGWDMKAMHRLMLTSATFRQSAHANPDAWSADPDNTWLARGPRFRLQAQLIRDMALTASGLLTPTIGGPSVYPPQPKGVFSLAYGSTNWPTETGANRYRRGLYTYQKRTAPYASAAVFDAPMAVEACVRRDRSNTPLQALTLLNDEVFLEAADALAENLYAHKGTRKEKIEILYLRCLNRPPLQSETQRILDYYDLFDSEFTENHSATRKFVGYKLNVLKEERIPVAAWKSLARVILNLDEAITRG